MHRTATIEIHGSRPQRVVRAGHQHFIAIVQECAQHQIDQLTDPIAYENFFGTDAGNTACLLLQLT